MRSSEERSASAHRPSPERASVAPSSPSHQPSNACSKEQCHCPSASQSHSAISHHYQFLTLVIGLRWVQTNDLHCSMSFVMTYVYLNIISPSLTIFNNFKTCLVIRQILIQEMDQKNSFTYRYIVYQNMTQ